MNMRDVLEIAPRSSLEVVIYQITRRKNQLEFDRDPKRKRSEGGLIKHRGSRIIYTIQTPANHGIPPTDAMQFVTEKEKRKIKEGRSSVGDRSSSSSRLRAEFEEASLKEDP